MEQVRDVAQSVEYTSGGREVARSNRVIPTRLQGFSLQPFLLSILTIRSLSIIIMTKFGRILRHIPPKNTKYHPFLKTILQKFGAN